MTTTEKPKTKPPVLWESYEDAILIKYWKDYYKTGELKWDNILSELSQIHPEGLRTKKSCEKRVERLRKKGLIPTDVEIVVDEEYTKLSHLDKYELLPKSERDIVSFLCKNSNVQVEELSDQLGISVEDINEYFDKFGIESPIINATRLQISMIKRWGPYRNMDWLQQKVGLPRKTIENIFIREDIINQRISLSDSQHNALKKLVSTLHSWDEIAKKIFGDNTKVHPDAVISYASEHNMIGAYDIKPIEQDKIIDMIIDKKPRREILAKFPYKDEYIIESIAKRNDYGSEWVECVQSDYNHRFVDYDGNDYTVDGDMMYDIYDKRRKKPKWRHTPKELITKELCKKDNWCSIPYLIDFVRKRLLIHLEPFEVWDIIQTIDKIESRNVEWIRQGGQRRYCIVTRSGIKYNSDTREASPVFGGRIRTPMVFISDLHIGYGEMVYGAWMQFVKFVRELNDKFGHVDIIVSGDILEGSLVYGGQDNNKDVNVDIDAQIQTAIHMFRSLSDPNITFHFVHGNHDFAYMKKTSSLKFDPIDAITKDLDNAIYHGEVAWLQVNENYSLAAVHGDRIMKGKNLQLKADTFLKRVDMQYRPDFMVMGHVHRRMKLPVGKTLCFVTPSLLQPPTELVTSQMVHMFGCGFHVIYDIDADGEPLEKFYKLTDGGTEDYPYDEEYDEMLVENYE